MRLLLDTHVLLWWLNHRDPFDRLLVAQAWVEQLTLVTSDASISRYDVALLDASQ